MTGATGGARHTITLLGKPDCHLCDAAREVIARVAAELGAEWEERDLARCDQEERDEYWDKIPVTFVDGAPHDFWRVSETRLRAALGAETPPAT